MVTKSHLSKVQGPISQRTANSSNEDKNTTDGKITLLGHDPTIHKGLCWCPGMEKEAVLSLNPRVYIRLQHQCFSPLLEEMHNRISHEYLRIVSKALLSIKNVHQITQSVNHIVKWDTSVIQFDCLGSYSFERIIQDAFDYRTLLFRDKEGCDDKTHYYKSYACRLLRPNTNNNNVLYCDVLHKMVLYNTRIDQIPCNCKGEAEHALKQILPVASNTGEVICYNSCNRTLFAAYKRQMQRVFPPDPTILTEFEAFVNRYFDQYVRPVLDSFDYSYTDWYNHLPAAKQAAMRDVKKQIDKNGYPTKVEYGLFCKREKQAAGGKNRAIANIDPVIKYVMGPVCWSLEHYADRFFPGYCGSKNWDQLEDMFSSLYKRGFMHVLQGDGSAFDTSQAAECKIIDRLIYNYIADHGKIHHVPAEVFKQLSTVSERHLVAKYHENKTMHSFARASIYGTVFSGASDTTLMNTMRMALYNMFTLERAGLQYDIDYRHLAKGDDFMVFTKEREWHGRSFEDIYYSIWSPKPKNSLTTDFRPHGIGQILKFLIIGDYTTIDFCSTMCVQDGDNFKLFRKPDRMNPLGHYSRSALKMKPAQLKQYLLDLAYSLEVIAGGYPLYQEYIDAYRYQASLIQAEPVIMQTGRNREILPSDGHHSYLDENAEMIRLRYHDYGHDFAEGMIFRHSTHKVSHKALLHILLTHYGITQIDIQYQKNLIMQPVGTYLYDSLADAIESNAQ